MCVNWCRNFTAIFCDFCKCLPWFLPFYRDFLLSLRRRYIFYPCLFVCLSVFLSVKDYSKPRAWISMKCCVSTDVETWTNWLTFEPDSDHSPDVGTGLLHRYRISAAMRNCEILRRENPIGGAPLERAVVLKWFYSLSRRKTFVGGECALPSALLVWTSNN